MTGAVGTYYSTIGHIDQGLFNSSLSMANSLVSTLLSKSFGAEFASIDVSDGYGGAVNGAATGYAGSMLGASTAYAGAGISIGDGYESSLIDAKVAYMKAAAEAQKTLLKSRNSQNFESYKETIDFKTDAAIEYYDYWFCTHACDGASESCRATTTVSPASMGYYPERIVWDNTWGYLGHEAFLLFSTGMLYEDPALLRLQQKNAAAYQQINLSYNKSMLEAAKEFTGSVIDAGQSAARASAAASQAAANAEIQAADAYCTAVEEAALAANEALVQIALGADPTGEIVSYLIAMAELEIDAEIAKMEALGTYQLGSKQEFLGTLSTTDSRYEAALADLRWTETTVESRNAYYASLGAATLQYQTSTYTAMNTYNNLALQRQAAYQTESLRRQSAYASSVRAASTSQSLSMLDASSSRELALIDAAFAEFRSNAEYEFRLAENAYNNYSSALAGLLDDDDSSYADFGSLAQSVSGMQAENYASIAAFQAEQAAARRAATEAAGSAYEAAVKSNDAGFALDSAVADVGYLSGQHEEDAEYLAEEQADYLSYMNTIKAAEKEFADEQCRLLGLLQDSVDTGYNTVSSGTSSLDVQVCFIEGFEIDLADGTSKKIEEFEGGEEVFARPHDDPNGPLMKCKVVRVFKNEPKETIKVRFGNGLELQGTAEHPFFVPKNGWVSLRDLQVGDCCVDKEGIATAVVSKEFVTEKLPVYNIEVEGAHTYYIGKDGKSLLVHNQCAIHQVMVASCLDCQTDWNFNSPLVTYINVEPTPESFSIFDGPDQFMHKYKIRSDEGFLREKGTKAAIRVVDENSVPSYSAPGMKFKLFEFDLGGGTVVGGGNVKIDNLDDIGKLALRHPKKIGEIDPEISTSIVIGYTHEGDLGTVNAGLVVEPKTLTFSGTQGEANVSIGADIGTKIGKHSEVKIGAGTSYDFKDKKPSGGASFNIIIGR